MHGGFVEKLLSKLSIKSLPGFLSALLLRLLEVTKAQRYVVSFLDFQFKRKNRKKNTYTQVCIHTHTHVHTHQDYIFWNSLEFPYHYIFKFVFNESKYVKDKNTILLFSYPNIA